MTMAQRVCGGCGSPVPETAPFCARCGTALRGVAQADSITGVPLGVQPTSTGPVFGPGVVFASAASRVWSWIIEGAVVGLFMGLLTAASIAGISGMALGGGGGVGAIIGLSFAPALALLVWGVATWVWEARTGNRLGSMIVRIRSVAVPDMSPPGMGRVFGSRVVIGLIGGVWSFAVQVVDTMVGAPALLVALLAGVGSLVVAGSCAWDRGQFRQGWHERASSTTMVTAASLVAFRSASGYGRASAPFAAPVPPYAAAPAGPSPYPAAPSPASPAPFPTPTVAPRAPIPVATPQAPLPPAMPAGPSSTGDGLIADVPGFAPAVASPAIASPAVERHEPAPLRTPVDDHVEDDAEIEHTQISAKSRRRAIHLSFDTGQQVEVAGLGLVGRAPAPAPGDDLVHTVEIDDPSRSVSKTHLAFGQDSSGLWVSDRGSTNGTRVLNGGVHFAEVGADPVHVPVGAVVEFGDRSFTVGTV